MTNNQFYKHFFNFQSTRSSRAARLVLVEKIGVNEAARRENINKASVSRAVKGIKG